jgi:acyl dehydratase
MPEVVVSMAEVNTLVGREIGVTGYFRVSQERINLFADATEDRQWIHTDVERAKAESPFGETVAHGFLTLSLIGHLTRDLIDVTGARLRVNYGLDRVRFTAPVPAGAKIRARVKVDSVEEIKGGVQVKLAVTVEREGLGKPCCFAEWLLRYYH